jgi:glycosyltransferase involved in cell wall biosynthesis
MRLLLATDVFPPRCGGSGWSTYALARTLRARGHAVAIVRAALDPRRAAPYDYDGFRVEQVAVAVPGVPVLRNVAKNEVFWALGGRALAAAARRHRADLIHGQHVMTIPAAVRAGRALGLPVVATVRDYWATCPISTLWPVSLTLSVSANIPFRQESGAKFRQENVSAHSGPVRPGSLPRPGSGPVPERGEGPRETCLVGLPRAKDRRRVLRPVR